MGSRNFSPVRPSYSHVLPVRDSCGTNSSRARSPYVAWFLLMRLRFAFSMASEISFSVAPSNTGVATCIGPSTTASVSSASSQPHFAAQPRWFSSSWPTFIREGTPRGLRMTSMGVPSAR